MFLATLTLLLSCRWLHVLACLVLAFLFAFRLTRRIESGLPAFRRLVRRSAARDGGAGGRRDRVVGRRAESWRTPGGRSHGPRYQRVVRTLQVRMSFWSYSTRCELTI